MNDIIVVDDFITKDYADHIEQIVNEKDFPAVAQTKKQVTSKNNPAPK